MILLFFLGLHLQSCGYRFGLGEIPAKYHSISIPYVIEDKTGRLTAALIKEVCLSGAFEYKPSQGDITLRVEVVDISKLNVGFRYDRSKKGKREHDLIPTETRITAIAEVSVTESCSGRTILGPVRISAYTEFDHDYYFGSDSINEFSLGQLTDYDAAYDSVQTPLNVALSKKIVDYVINSW